MFDVEICLPAEENFQQRFIDFKKYGLQNIGKYKIKLVLLASHDNSTKTFNYGWSKEISEVQIVKTPYKHVSQRISFYYEKIIDPSAARWFLRVDEDSFTDITGLIDKVDERYDYEKDFYITSELVYDLPEPELSIWKSFGFNSWFEHAIDYPPHEYETSIVSLSCMKKIMNAPYTNRFFKLRSKFDQGFGDIGLCLCARAIKIHPLSVRFLTHTNDFFNFSIYGGFRNHVHYMSREKIPHAFEWLDMLEKKDLELERNIFFLKKINENKKGIIYFEKSGLALEKFLNTDKKKILGYWGLNELDQICLYVLPVIEKINPILIFDINTGLPCVSKSNPNYILQSGSIDEIVD